MFKYIYEKYGHLALASLKRTVRTSGILSNYNRHLQFANACRREGLIPTSLKVKILVNTAGGVKTANRASRMFLSNRISECYNKIKKLKLAVHVECTYLSTTLEGNDFVRTLEFLKSKTDMAGARTERRHDSKLHNLRKKVAAESREAAVYTEIAQDNVINLSSCPLTANQREALGLGLGCALGNKKANLPKILSELEPALVKLQPLKQEMMRAEIAHALMTTRNYNSTHMKKHEMAIDSLRENRDIKILNSDKGRKVVVLNLQDYKDKVYEHLGDTNAYKKLKKDPTPSIKRKLNATINNLIKLKMLPEGKAKYLKNNNGTLPIFYGLPKIHKQGVPIRPILNSRDSPVFSLSRFLAEMLSPLLLRSTHIINNIAEFVKKLQSMNVPDGYILASFDVVALYTSIPLDLVETVLHFYIDDDVLQDLNQSMGTNLDFANLKSLTMFCLSSTSFRFGDDIYQQTQGVGMGLPLSSIVANLVLMHIERDIVDRVGDDIWAWYRYVDDVFCIVRETRHQEILSIANSINAAIVFTCELEIEGRLPYLDIQCERRGPIIHTTVYRKPIAGNVFLNYKSCNPITHKIAVIRTLTARMMRYCSTEELRKNEECKIIKDLMHNDYPKSFIVKQMYKMIRDFYYTKNDESSTTAIATRRQFLTTTYFPGISERLRRVFARENIQMAFKPTNKIRSLVDVGTPRVMDDEKGVVYSLSCGSCDSSYVGQSGRSFGTRKKEHSSNFNKAVPNSKLVDHMIQNNHIPDWSSGQIHFKNIVSLPSRIFLESFTSKFLLPKNFNESAPFPLQYGVLFYKKMRPHADDASLTPPPEEASQDWRNVGDF